jgi:hypothetical protein
VWTLERTGPRLRGIVTSVNHTRSTDSGVCDSYAVALRRDILREVKGWVDQDVADGLCGGRRTAIALPA